jgi:hypothetical protein
MWKGNGIVGGGGNYKSRDMHKQSIDTKGEPWMGGFYSYCKNYETKLKIIMYKDLRFSQR